MKLKLKLYATGNNEQKEYAKEKRTLMSTGYSGTYKSIVLKLYAVTAWTTHFECHSLDLSNMSFVDSRQLWLVIVTYNMEEGWVGRKKNDQKEITSQTADKHDTIMTGINELKGDAQENC